jgi:protocatechuate 3,4-dioxygenase alpha subunit
MSNPATTSQTLGPFFSIGLSYRNNSSVCAETVDGAHITLSGQVWDGAGTPVSDAQLELWQADSHGRFAGVDPEMTGSIDAGFEGFSRIPTDEHGAFRFQTILPGTVSTLDGVAQAPHIVVVLMMRGILKHLITRIYFANDARNDADPILNAVPQERRSTLLAQLTGAPGEYRWDIHLQGEHETVFFAY